MLNWSVRGNQKGFVEILLIIGVVVLITITGGLYYLDNKEGDNNSEQESSPNLSQSETQDQSSSQPPDNLSLPFNINDISLNKGILNPLGIIRHDRDSGHGHGGIDIPLKPGSTVTAVSGGEVVEISKVSNTPGDEKLVILVNPTNNSEGWVFLYEHLLINRALKVGDKVEKGDYLATHEQDSRTSHYQLSYAFNNLEYYEQGLCWTENLSEDDQKSINEFWETYRNSDYAQDAWKSITEDGNYSYLALFDETNFPNGIQLCYEGNTDARVPL